MKLNSGSHECSSQNRILYHFVLEMCVSNLLVRFHFHKRIIDHVGSMLVFISEGTLLNMKNLPEPQLVQKQNKNFYSCFAVAGSQRFQFLVYH